MNPKTKKITTFVVSTVAAIAAIVTLLIGVPAHSTGETVDITNSVATTTKPMTIQTMTETTISTVETTTITEATDETTATVTTKQTTAFIMETQKPTTETVLITTEPIVTCCGATSGDIDRIENTEDIEARRCSECNPSMEIITEYTEPVPEPGELTYVEHFTRGTYYAYGGPREGGSQRQLIDCSIGDGTVRGSIASSYLYQNYGYNYNGKRTMVYLEIEGYSQMSGYYYLDDCDAGNPNVIDFFFLYESNCPFKEQGIVQVDCYIVN